MIFVEMLVFIFRYASLYFVVGIESGDNELITLEIIHRYVELLDKYFGNVSHIFPSWRYLFQQWKHQSNVWNLFKVDNKDTNYDNDVVLLSLLLTLNIFHTLLSMLTSCKQRQAGLKHVYKLVKI